MAYLMGVFFLCFMAPTGLEAGEVSFEVRVGERVQDWCKRLEARGLLTCRAVLDLAAAEDFAPYAFVDSARAAAASTPDRPFLGNRFEGAFTPGTYSVPLHAPEPDQAAHQIVALLLEKSRARFAALRDTLGLTPRQQRILASMVEKEAVSNTAYDTVAAVFHNRLRRDDRLGSCPTVEYALGFHRPFLLHKDLAAVAASPYNMYKKKGLPPTPICFFSDAALAAVRAPAVADSVYFFVYDWTTGRLQFEKIDGYNNHRRNAARSKENYRRRFGDIRQVFPDKFYQR